MNNSDEELEKDAPNAASALSPFLGLDGNDIKQAPPGLGTAGFGMPNTDLDEEMKAVVQPMDFTQTREALEAELIEFSRQHLSMMKSPRSIDFNEKLPRHPNGKLYKRF